jgi:hypothetical protein
MTISDVLSDAREDILGYLKDPKDYAGEEIRRRIGEVVLAMDKLRLSPEFDLPPSAVPIPFPNDGLTYLNALLKDRAVNRPLGRLASFTHVPDELRIY